MGRHCGLSRRYLTLYLGACVLICHSAVHIHSVMKHKCTSTTVEDSKRKATSLAMAKDSSRLVQIVNLLDLLR